MGVAQDSVLGPLLFSIHINVLTKLELNGELFLFADDATLVIKLSNFEDLIFDANTDFLKVFEYFKKKD